MLAKIFVITAVFIIFACLTSGLWYLVGDKGKGRRVVKALTWRIAISLTLFILLFVGFAFGYLQPHGVMP